MNWTKRLIHSVSGAVLGRKPAQGRLLLPRRADAMRDYPSTGLTPSRLAAILRDADRGALTDAMQLFEEMEEKDAHLHAVANMRRLALTGLPWRVASAAERRSSIDRSAADDAAAYCNEVLRGIDNFEDALQHLSLAIGRNLAVVELVWESHGEGVILADTVPVDFGRIVLDEFDRLRILTDEFDRDGIDPPAHKFMVHSPHSVSGHPARGGLLRATALAYLAKNLALKDWMIFAEVFGMPVRIARFEPSATAEEKRELLDMLESLGSNAAGIFSRAIELEFVEAGKGKAPPPYERLVDFLNREISKAWLGQTLTTEVSGVSGSIAASRVHDEVRGDLLADDMRKEARTLRRDLLGPLVALKFGPDAPVPCFERQVDQPRDLTELADLLDAAVNRLGVRVPLQWAHDSLGIPIASDGEPALSGADQKIMNQRPSHGHRRNQ